MKMSTINLRVAKQLKDDFEIYAKSNDLTTSQAIRHYMAFQAEQFKKMSEKK